MLSPSLGLGEIIVLALVAIIVVGPKDLPKLMRNLGLIMGRVRAMGQEFKDAFTEMEAEDEIAAMRREIEELKSLGHLDYGLDDDDEAEMTRSDYRRSAMRNSAVKPEADYDGDARGSDNQMAGDEQDDMAGNADQASSNQPNQTTRTDMTGDPS